MEESGCAHRAVSGRVIVLVVLYGERMLVLWAESGSEAVGRELTVLCMQR